MPTPRPFTIYVPDETLADLRMRLERTRWPDENPGDGWQYGSDLGYMKALAGYWREKYDWRAHEARLNRLQQFVASVNGIHLHFIHEPGVGPNPLPLLLSHGWPGSIVEFERLIPLLTDPDRFGGDPADAFTVVAPSLPGYTFSFRPNHPRLNIARIADVFARLMADVLGYRRFAAQGGDWGAYISAQLGAAHVDRVVGIHVTLLSGPREATPTPQTDEERAYIAELQPDLRKSRGLRALTVLESGQRSNHRSFEGADDDVASSGYSPDVGRSAGPLPGLFSTIRPVPTLCRVRHWADRLVPLLGAGPQ